MFIQTEVTPNPESMKFIIGKILVEDGSMNFSNKESAKSSMLVEKIFDLGFVNNVFIGNDFITITKNNDYEWDIIKTEILVTLVDFFVAGFPIINNIDDEVINLYNENDSEIVKQIKELIEIRVRPAVMQDGGDIIFRSFEEGVVKLELRGACSGCPSSIITLKDGIENMLKHYIPEVQSVESI